MPELGETMRLVELVCARLCHDLGGLIGTVGNAVDMAAEDAGGENEILAFASSASRVLSQRLRLMRTAWAADTGAIALPAMLNLVSPLLSARRISVDARMLSPDTVFSQAIGRVALNLLILACDCMPKGGTVVLAGEPNDLLLRINGPDAAWPPGITACMHDEAAALGMLAEARAVQMPLTVLLARSRGMRLSAVLGPSSGIEALRLAPA